MLHAARLVKVEIGTMGQVHQADLLAARIRAGLPKLLPNFLIHQRWFGGKARRIHSAEVLDVIPIPVGERSAFLVLVGLKYSVGKGEIYALPLISAEGERRPASEGEVAGSILRLSSGQEKADFCDAFLDKEFSTALLEAICSRKSYEGSTGEFLALPTEKFHDPPASVGSDLDPALMKAEQSNTSVRYGDRYILKFFRRLEEGVNPDLEIGTFLTRRASFEHTPPVQGTLEFRRPRVPAIALGILQAFVPNRGDAWRHALGALDIYFEGVPSAKVIRAKSVLPLSSIPELGRMEIPPQVPKIIGDYWDSAGLLGRRTGQLHIALASDSKDPNLCPEPFSSSFQQSQSDSMRNLTLKVLRALEERLVTLPPSIHDDARNVLKLERDLLSRFESFAKREITGKCIRIHGDYHLGQLLYTGSDFVIIDFEGEPARPLEERRKKRSPLQDVAGMLRSFHYAAHTALSNRGGGPESAPNAGENLKLWAQYWQQWVSARFLREYLSVASKARFLPLTENEFAVLLQAYLLEKAIYELGYELNNRPDWVWLPIQGILQLMEP
jgi:maltose alpha-D-glucosyltransferase / alpha-amylase